MKAPKPSRFLEWGFGGGLGLLVGLKLTRVVAWSWWLILLPLEIPVVLLALMGIAAAYMGDRDDRGSPRRGKP